MAKVGTGFVDIRPDFSGFTAELKAQMTGLLAGIGEQTIKASVKVDIDRSQLSRFGGSGTGSLGREIAEKIGPITPEVEPDVDHNWLARLRQRIGKLKLDVDIDRVPLARSIGTALQGAAAGLGGVLGRIPGIGGLFAGLSSALGTTALGATVASTAILALVGVLAALAASLGAAIAGLGALAIAFGAALGPAVLVTVGAFIRFAEIIKAVKDHQANAGAETRGLAGAQDQLRAATDAISQAQTNLREQTTAAYQAWADAIENVKDDLLGVKDAQLGIDESRLSLREAKQELVDFRKQAGAAGDAFGDVFKKFTDVNVDTTGLRAALKAAAGSRGLGGDDELKLERLILNVRRAKLNESHATDTLHDANTKLVQDRKTEADFARRGIAAYKPYTAATQQLASAHRSLASAQRASAAATERQTKAWDDLSPAERKFGAVLIEIGKTLGKVFTPVMTALLAGVTRGLQSFAAAADDPRIKQSLVETGRALGGAFASLAKTLTSPEMRRAFVEFAGAGVKIVKSFGTKVFADLALILVRLAVVTLPLLLGFLDRVTAWFDGLERSSRNTKNLRDDVKHVVGVFNDWVTLLGVTATGLLNIGRFLEPIGTGIVRFLSHPLKSLGDLLGATKRDAEDFGKVFAPIQRAAAGAISGVIRIFRGMNTVIGGIIRVLAGLLTGDFREAWNGVKGIFRGAITEIKGILQLTISPFRAIGKHLGTAIINGLIGIINIGIRGLNKVLGPRNLGPLGHTPDLRIGEITPIGAPDGTNIHKRKPSSGPAGEDPRGVFSTALRAAPRFGPIPVLAGAGPSQVIEHVDINVKTPSGALPDARVLAEQTARELQRRR